MKIEKYNLIRSIYLYVATLIGLVILIIGAGRFIDMGLRTYIFTKADENIENYFMPAYSPVVEKFESVDKFATASVTLTVEEKEAMNMWLNDYKAWKKSPKVDYVTQQRHRDAAVNLSLILIGLPLYLYHWLVIRKESKRK